MSGICYLYGVVPAGADASRAPAGIDDRPVELIAGSGHAALFTSVSATDYAPEKIESLAGNVDWVRYRAEAHDRVLNWASDTTRVIPLPMWTMFHDDSAVKAMLAEREREFAAALANVAGAREYTVRAYVRASELQSKVSDLSEEFRALEAQTKTASPGQKYLLERKIEKERKETARRVMRQVAADVHSALAVSAKGSVRDEISPGVTPSDHGQAILNASYLVASAEMTEFQKTLTEFVNRYQPSGFTFAFTGPWPPYHFVGPQGGSEAVG
ncbi:MAG: GvpL/GvpF family gas vesicle protein [Gemmatimonadota bacterium]|nr:GvpL/GvpF family gas vesicle protein [Gemmatimonadota bacterium]